MSDVHKLFDDFTDDQRAGSVIGSRSTSGHKRLGVDCERVLSIDNGALRIAPVIEAGWARTVLAYGPFGWRPGLAFVVHLLNGHNTSQAEPLPDTFRERIYRWLKGSEIDPLLGRMFRWLISGRIRRTIRQFRRWNRMADGARPVPLLDENLAVGWFGQEVVQDPRLQGSMLIMHALGPENGELWAGATGNRTRCLRGVQNLPLYFVGVTRTGGTIFYVASVEGAAGLSPHPLFRPVAVDRTPLGEQLYLGIHQSVLGQIGFRLDTRLYSVRVGQMPGYESWFGGAHAADRLPSGDLQTGVEAEVGGRWRVLEYQSKDEDSGISTSLPKKICLLDPGQPTGLIHALVSMENGPAAKVGLVWRFVDERNHWRVELSERACDIILVSNGECQVLASREYAGLSPGQKLRLQVLDDGNILMVYVDGEPVVEGWLADSKFEGATGVGILNGHSGDASGFISFFEAHGRQIKMPQQFEMGEPWMKMGSRLVVGDDFDGEAGDLEGRPTSSGGARWTRLIGRGVFEVTGDRAARVRGSVEKPCPGRTAYCIDWEYPEFADLEVTIIPPGSKKGQKEHAISGFILYQDSNNYVILNVWRSDSYGGASISTFFKFNGFEDLYDAIWTNVGNRVYYGRPARLRLCCDGERYFVYVNEEPVLYRCFRDVYADVKDLAINKIGLIANWEWGRDTGSTFREFRARF